ncbi:taurine ABC transporter substrate-binding protein [Paralcaligenes ureilyticus]|uniref:Taurine transport system substrate-binding protein n=1 Tax=Paralcaligenes ureilyticus TaxID=627131 RepID=A0A4R3LU31_9BURK|nr:taurine ABC transporter substrate-binding protein [Paralcaligenes ureilyticus]TCT03099.1 taurine transport system substrate-binding protein [Paralcaligenes ureilyticus]
MKTFITKIAIALTLTIGLGAAANAEKVIIGTFGDPTPSHVAIAQGKFVKATGWNIEWRKFASGADVIAAMASGDVQLSELGSSPLAIAASQGVDVKLFLISFLIGSSESLIVRNGSGIDKTADLKGKRIAVPIGSTSHFSLMGALSHWGINQKDVKIIGMSPDQINAAWAQKAIDAAFVWNPVQSVLLENGKRLISAGEIAKWGYPTFNGWVVNPKFAAKNAKSMAAFAKTMNEANADYLNNKAKWTADSTPIKQIAQSTGAQASQVPTILDGFTFLTASQQGAWLDSHAADALKRTADFLKANGRIDTVSKNYSPFVDSAIAKSVQ